MKYEIILVYRQAAIHDQRNEAGPNYINKEVPSPISERKNLLFALMSRNPFKCSYTWVAERKKKKGQSTSNFIYLL